jgi:hypothetical protein
MGRELLVVTLAQPGRRMGALSGIIARNTIQPVPSAAGGAAVDIDIRDCERRRDRERRDALGFPALRPARRLGDGPRIGAVRASLHPTGFELRGGASRHGREPLGA